MSSVYSCPTWSEEIPSHEAARFREVAVSINTRVRASSRSKIIEAEDVREWHGVLFSNFVPLAYYAGGFRCDDPTKPCLRKDVEVGGVPGVTFCQVRATVDALFEKVRKDLVQLEITWGSLDARQRAIQLAWTTAEAVGQFIRIHPFLNGNGRMSRLMWRWYLYRFGVPPQCQVCERPKPPYTDVMREAMLGNIRPLALYVLQYLSSNHPRITR